MMLLLDILITLPLLLLRPRGKDIVQFAKAVEISSPTIDGKVCAGSHARGKNEAGSNASITEYGRKGEQSVSTKTAQCSGLAASGVTADKVGLTKFVNVTRVGEGENWPTGYVNKSNNIDTVGDTNSNAKAVATDLVALNRDEKTIVAGLLAKTIEGGEVVEIRAVSSTFIRI